MAMFNSYVKLPEGTSNKSLPEMDIYNLEKLPRLASSNIADIAIEPNELCLIIW
jgi:hypothetical protein